MASSVSIREFLASLSSEDVFVNIPDEAEQAVKAEVKKAEKTSSCTICPFFSANDLASFRSHFRSDWHINNLRLLQSNREALSLEEYEESGEESPDEPLDPCDGLSPIVAGSAFISFSSPRRPNQRFSIYKRVVPQEFVDRKPLILEALRKIIATNWIVFLVRSGRFAAAVYRNNDGQILASKTFKRYTSRRGQGGSQSVKDRSSGHRIKSAGANLRRINETRLAEDILTIINSWKSYIVSASLIFWTPTDTARFCLFQSDFLRPGINKVNASYDNF